MITTAAIYFFTGTCFGVALGFAFAPTKPEPAEIDVARERYRDAAVSACEAQLQNFGASTQWDKMRQARAQYLVEARED